MAGRRPLTAQEERAFIRTSRRLPPRDRALCTTELFLGYRSFEVISLTVGQVWRDGAVLPQIGLPPRHRKGRHGATQWIPVGPELRRALEHYLNWRTRDAGPLRPGDPLFVGRTRRPDGSVRPIGRKRAYEIVMAAFARAGIKYDGRLGTHSLRKTFAIKCFKNSGNNLLVCRDALGHASCGTTEAYLECRRDEVAATILKGDWTRRPRRAAFPGPLGSGGLGRPGTESVARDRAVGG